MNWSDFFAAVALLLIFEGMLPFLNPNRWRLMIRNVLQQNDAILRIIGFSSMMAGVILLYIVRGL